MITGFILILIVLVPLCIYLYFTNIKLKQEIEILKQENKKILERKILNSNNTDIKSIQTISTPLKIKPSTKKQKNTKEPISIVENKKIKKASASTFNVDDYIKHNTSTKEEYLKDISNKINKNISPQTIELTTYEKEQEENAIISYQELKKQLDSPNHEETEKFIEALKNLRNNLNQKK